jgi:predicted amidohydrolase
MKLGVFQAACGGCGFETRLSRLDRALSDAPCDLVVCPELFATGYHIDGLHADLAEPAEGKFFKGFAALAEKHGCIIAYGYPEDAPDGPFNSAAVVSADGQLLANHRKRLPSPNSFEETSFVPSASDTLFEMGGFSVAVAICYEIEFPETARKAAQAGADLLIVPTALVEAWPVVAEQVVPTRAFENGIWVAYANHGGTELAYTYLGGSRIVAPNGTQPAVADAAETLITATIDKDAVKAAQARLPYLRDCIKL